VQLPKLHQFVGVAPDGVDSKKFDKHAKPPDLAIIAQSFENKIE
jgi:hypothetical protein